MFNPGPEAAQASPRGQEEARGPQGSPERRQRAPEVFGETSPALAVAKAATKGPWKTYRCHFLNYTDFYFIKLFLQKKKN